MSLNDGGSGPGLLAGTVSDEPAQPGQPTLRWTSRARSIADVERELTKIWASTDRTVTDGSGEGERRIAARTSVMNLVVIARRPEVGQRAAATITALTGRHPSRTIVVSSMDPDGPSWLDARIQAYCMLPRADAPETCAEFIHLTAGGDSGRHLAAIVAPLLIHDLPVMVWWPGEPPFGTDQSRDVLGIADRLVVDGSGWSGDGFDKLARLAEIASRRRPVVFDFGLVRQARWREAIASVFDRPEFLPYLRSIRRIAVTYATSELDAPGGTNAVKPVYHVAWLASRLAMTVREPLTEVGVPGRRTAGGAHGRGLNGTLRLEGHDVAVVIRPVVSTMRPGTTLRVELLAERRGSELRADVTAEAELVRVRVWEDGIEVLDRSFRAPRQTDVDLLMEAIESSGRDAVTTGAIRMAAALVGRQIHGRGPGGRSVGLAATETMPIRPARWGSA